MTCHPNATEVVEVVKAQPEPTPRGVTLAAVKTGSRSRAADALRREALYREQMGLPMGDEHGDIHA